MREIERLLDTGVEGVAQEDRWLLEIDQDNLLSYSVEDKQFWLNAVNAAMKAAMHALDQSDGATNSWAEVMRDGKFCRECPKEENNEERGPQRQEKKKKKVVEEGDEKVAQQPSSVSVTQQQKKQRKEPEEETQAEEDQQTAGKLEAPKRKHEIIERYKGERRAKMTRAAGAKKSKSLRQLWKLKQPDQPPNFDDCTPPATGVQHVSTQALEKDTLGLFSEDTSLSTMDNTIISDAFKRKCRIVQKRDAQGNDVMEELAVLKIRRTDIKQSEFLRLRDGVWLNDTLIYCFLKKYVQDKIPKVYCLESHFMTRLIKLDGEYNYERVKRWGRKFPKANPTTSNQRG